jgi:hypothetical protein
MSRTVDDEAIRNPDGSTVIAVVAAHDPLSERLRGAG